MKCKVSYAIECGINKNCCEDSALIGTSVINNQSGVGNIEAPFCVFLCDGVGGLAGGYIASNFVCDALHKFEVPESVEIACNRLEYVNSQLLSYAATTAEYKMMATTATGLFVSGSSMILCHIGNTRLYVRRGAYLQQITDDHTTQKWLMSIGRNKEAQQCNKSEIRGAMGGGNRSYMNMLLVQSVFEKTVPAMILLTTDGIHDYLSEDEMEQIITDTALSDLEKVKSLCAKAISNHSEDDRSAIIVSFEGFSYREDEQK